MNIVAASQQFAVQEYAVLHSGRIESAPLSRLQTTIQPPPPTSLLSLPDHQNLTSETSEPQSTEAQNEDKQPFNAMQSVGAVKKILEQLSAGKLLTWLDGNSLEKIQAQIAAPQNLPESAALQPSLNREIVEWSYRVQQLSADFQGSLHLDDGTELSWNFQFSMSEQHFSLRYLRETDLQDPLVMSFNGQGTQLLHQGQSFDFFGNGQRYQLPDLAQDQYYLMYDRNLNQHLDDGLELFGPTTGQGFAELAALDHNGNGFLEAHDPSWQQLGLWSNQQGWKSLNNMGVTAISTLSAPTNFALYEQDRLLGRIARSGIFLTDQQAVTSKPNVGLIQQVDLSI